VTRILKPDVLRLLDEMVANGAPSAAAHAFAAIRKFFNWSVERGYLEVSPCLTVKTPARQKSRERVLSDDELALVWNGASRLGWPAGPIVHLLILTAQRRGEVAGMRWQDVDLDGRLWSIPAEMTKSNRAHSVPLTELAANIILTLPRIDPVWVFPARGKLDRPYHGFNKAKRRLDELARVQQWTLHDLRRTTATGMAKRKVPPHVVERLLNHASGTFAGVAGVYNRFGYLDEMREALCQWEGHLTQLIGVVHTGTVASPQLAD
jgi:integrase